ncbi:MAG: phosphate/phosphite/phosphonate ABC transporter substrate-binding protein [Thermodesulfobacteriota bacterium]|nr:phosphate/phosphite/phosphonate ABC transporter substrate-binding protein [Thermodesulfobacteriota bacterium]
MKKVFKSRVFFLCIGLLLWCTNAGAEIRKDTLIIGRVSDNPKKHYKRLKPMVDYVVSRLSDLGITRSGVLMAKNDQEMIEYLKEGKVDWVTETLFSALLFCDETDAEIMVRRWKEGRSDYCSIFFARKDSGINSINNLKGKKIAFEDPGSTTGYFVPMTVLKKTGLKPVKLASPREKPPAEGIGYVFAGRDINITTWVHKGLVDAGVYSDIDWENSDDCPPAFKKNLRIIYKSGPFPRAMEIIRKAVDPVIKKRIKEILLNAHKDPKAKKALNAYRETKRFDELTEKAKEQLDAARQMLEYFQKQNE